MSPHPEFERNPEPASEELSRLLDAWQPAPELAPGFEARLRSRLAAAESAPRWWQIAPLRWAGAMAVLVLLAGAGLLFSREGRRAAAPTPAAVAAAPESAPAAAAVPQVAQNAPPAASGDAITRDLQALNSDQDLLNHLDFLSAPAAAAQPAPLERD